MCAAHDVRTTLGVALDQWPDPPTAFTTTASRSGRLHIDPRCSQLRRAAATTTVHRTWAQASATMHRCAGADMPVDDVGFQRHRMTQWIQLADDTARRAQPHPGTPGQMTDLFADLQSLDRCAIDTRARPAIAAAWQVAAHMATDAVARRGPDINVLLTTAAAIHEPSRANVSRPPGFEQVHTAGQGPALRRGWDVMCDHLAHGTAAARAACVHDWATERLDEPTSAQLRHVRVRPAAGDSVGLDDLLTAWQELFVAEATVLLDHWLDLITTTVGEYTGLPPFHLTGSAAHRLQGVWPAVPGHPDTVEVPALVAVATVGRGLRHPVRNLPVSPQWPKALLDLAGDVYDEAKTGAARALLTAATIAA